MKKATEEGTLKDMIDNQPQVLSEGIKLAKLLMMQTEKRKFDKMMTELRQDMIKHGYRQSDDEMDDFLDKIEEEESALAENLEKANFWITPSMNLDFLLKLQKISTQHNLVAQKIEKSFLNYYSMKNYLNIKNMVKSWKKVSFFTSRMKIINDARDAHINHKYTLSIPAMLPQIEGILSDLTQKPAGRPGKIFEETLMERYSDVNKHISKNIVHKLALGSALYGNVPSDYFMPEKYAKWVLKGKNEDDFVINRHAILHGVQVNYATASNSLRTFLLLDILYWMSKD